MKRLDKQYLSSVNWGKLSHWNPSNVEDTYFSTSSDAIYTEKPMLHKRKNNNVSRSVDYNNLKLVSIPWVHSSKIVNEGKKK